MDEKGSAAAVRPVRRPPLIGVPELLSRLGEPGVRVIDARFELMEPAVGAELYASGHVPGAVHLDLDRDLAAPPGERGRHPLPDLKALAARLGELGVGRQHEVVVYDQTGSMYAARAWWLLRYLGHDAVRSLDGGFREYLAAGGPVTTEGPTYPPTSFAMDVRTEMVLDQADIVARLGDPDLVLLDARSPERYRGEVEPLDPKPGHVPGAVNMPYAQTTSGSGMLPPAELRRLLRSDELPVTADVVAYCGSGVSAAQLVLALEVAGRSGVRLYPGSWSEWSRRDDLPVGVGDEAPRW